MGQKKNRAGVKEKRHCGKAYKKELMAEAEAKKILLKGEAKIELLERAKRLSSQVEPEMNSVLKKEQDLIKER